VIILRIKKVIKMKKEEIFKALGSYKKKLEQLGYEVIYIGLYGSQNYNCNDELSDIDAKAIVLPTLDDIVFRKVTSKVIDCENGTIDVKDLITFYDVIRKGNFSYIEAIDTEYSIGDKTIKEMFKQYRPNLKSILGAMHEKRKALTHEYPSKTKEFDKWGFDPKQFHHIVRLYDLLKYGGNKSYITYHSKFDIDYMIGLKRNKDNLSINYVETQSDIIIEKAKELIPKDYKYDIIDLNSYVGKYIKEKIELNIIKNHPTVSARQYRTFDTPIPKKDLEKFPVLEQYKGQDISYIVYESIDIL